MGQVDGLLGDHDRVDGMTDEARVIYGVHDCQASGQESLPGAPVAEKGTLGIGRQIVNKIA